jgi:hypothetical protein
MNNVMTVLSLREMGKNKNVNLVLVAGGDRKIRMYVQFQLLMDVFIYFDNPVLHS